MDLKLSEDQAAALREVRELVEYGGVGLLTGRAGTGKSTLLRAIREEYETKAVMLAPTGIAALNVEGQTIHSFFRLKPQTYDVREAIVPRLDREFRRLVKEMELLVIDEVSMVRADLLDAIDAALKLIVGSDLPFGGKPLLLVGDLMQLEPVVSSGEERAFFEARYASPFAFDAHALKMSPLIRMNLTTNHRQAGDEAFFSLLGRVRQGDSEAIEAINTRVDPQPKLGDGAIVLCATNAAADALNGLRMAKLPEPARQFTGRIDGEFRERDLPVPQSLELRVGAQVMVAQNDRVVKNGQIGRIVAMDETSVTLSLPDREDHRLTMGTWERRAYEWDRNRNEIKTKIVGKYTQMPLRPAWAVTIHKSQGLTFDRVHIDLGRGAFAHGQTYVALSRSRTLEGMTLRFPLEPEDLIVSDHVRAFTMIEGG